MKKKVRIGTRKSLLALYQAQKVSNFFKKNNYEVELVEITTTGDKFLEDTLAKTGGKGLFIKEIESALARKEIDIAVHSLKDIPSGLDDRFTLSAFLKRDDPRDIWISRGSLPSDKRKELVIGTSSLRRQKQLKIINPEFHFKILRGNIDTRIRKLEKEEYDAIVLAYAGLLRLNIQKQSTYIFSTDEIVPSAGQGVIAVESRKNDAINRILKKINNKETEECVELERALQNYIGGDCFLPLGINIEKNNNNIACRLFLQLGNRKTYLRLKIEKKPDEQTALLDEVKKKIDNYRGDND